MQKYPSTKYCKIVALQQVLHAMKIILSLFCFVEPAVLRNLAHQARSVILIQYFNGHLEDPTGVTEVVG